MSSRKEIGAILWIIFFAKSVIGHDLTSIALVKFGSIDDTFQKSLDLVGNQTKNSSLDLIVFPENYGNLTTFIKVGGNPCADNKSDETLKYLSCFANSTKVHLVINIKEKKKIINSNIIYNTDVLFSDNGTILNKYRKINLNPEEFGKISVAKHSESTAISFTIKGETFGLLTSLDILFQTPAETLLKKNITKFILTTGRNWSLGLPFLTASQIQQMWAQVHNVTLYTSGQEAGVILAGGSKPLIFGNWSKNGIYIYNSQNSTINYLDLDDSNLTKISGNLNFHNPTISSSLLKSSKSQLLNVSNTEEQNATICYYNHVSRIESCCKFKVKIEENPAAINYTYQMVALVGNQTYDNFHHDFGVEICAILACPNSSLTSCGELVQTTANNSRAIHFEKLEIIANFTKGSKTQYPNSLLDQTFQPIKEFQTIWSQKSIYDSSVETTFATKETVGGLLTFAIYGRDFKMDYSIANDPNSTYYIPNKNSSSRIVLDSLLLITILLSILIPVDLMRF